MSEQPMSSSSKKIASFRSLGVSVSYFIFSCCVPVLFQPLHFCYFLFFLPYIVKILSFLSPLFITTSLVLLSLHLSFQELNSASPFTGESNLSEELELYQILFETSEENVVEQEVLEIVDKFLIHEATVKEAPVEKNEAENQGSKIGEAHIREKEEFDGIAAFTVEGQEVKQLGTEPKKVVTDVAEREEALFFLRGESNAHVGNKITPRRQRSRNFSLPSDGLAVPGDMNPRLGSFGSMRKEKEWRRTLACKLFEERHNAGGGGGGGEEDMDLLWEKYEEDTSSARARLRESKKKGNVAGTIPKAKPERQHEGENEDEDEEDVNAENLCCLQALKFSAGKINLGLGRPNIMSISRTLRGFGWFHNLTRHKRV